MGNEINIVHNKCRRKTLRIYLGKNIKLICI